MTEIVRSDLHPEIESYGQVNREVLRMLSKPGKAYWTLLFFDLFVLAVGAACWGKQIYEGIGVAGIARPVGWGVYIVTFVFWVGIGHAGTLISAILFLFRAKWRQSIYRASEAMTVFAVLTAGLFPLIHVGRVWYGYWLVPYPNQRGLWSNFRSPLLWDVFAISTYLTVSATFFVLGMIPDIAAARDGATVPWRKKLYTILSMGWQGSHEEWRHYTRAYLYLAGLATPLVLSVHSVVSFDFAMSQVPGWHATIFGPYFVAGAIFSGVGMVITILVPMRKIFHLEAYLTPKHFDAMAKLIMLTSMIVGYAYLSEFFVAWYGQEAPEMASFWNRVFGQWWWAAWVMLGCNMIIPLLLWFRRVRTNIPALFVISIFINIGMWFERYVIFITSLSHDYDPFAFGTYRPTFIDMGLLLGSFAWFFMWFLMFIRVLPPVAVSELKEVLPPPMKKPPHENHGAPASGFAEVAS